MKNKLRYLFIPLLIISLCVTFAYVALYQLYRSSNTSNPNNPKAQRSLYGFVKKSV